MATIIRTGIPTLEPASDGTYSVVFPVVFRRRGARKAVTLPNGREWALTAWNEGATPLQRALVRGFRWLAMLESGEAASITDLAAAEGAERATVSRCLTLTTLAPDIVQAILEETIDPNLTLMELATGTPLLWQEQRQRFLEKRE